MTNYFVLTVLIAAAAAIDGAKYLSTKKRIVMPMPTITILLPPLPTAIATTAIAEPKGWQQLLQLQG